MLKKRYALSNPLCDSVLYTADWTINCNFCETDEEQTAFCVDWSFCGLMAHICLWILLFCAFPPY